MLFCVPVTAIPVVHGTPTVIDVYDSRRNSTYLGEIFFDIPDGDSVNVVIFVVFADQTDATYHVCISNSFTVWDLKLDF